MSNKTTAIGDKNESDRLDKFFAEVHCLNNTTLMNGWDLIAQDIALDETERERLLQEIPYFREQAVQTVAYWMSLSRRIDALTRTRQLLAHMPASQATSTSDPCAATGSQEYD
jgi:hypothetical protein